MENYSNGSFPCLNNEHLVKIPKDSPHQPKVDLKTIIAQLINSFCLDSDTRLSVDERPTTSQESSTDSHLNNDRSYKQDECLVRRPIRNFARPDPSELTRHAERVGLPTTTSSLSSRMKSLKQNYLRRDCFFLERSSQLLYSNINEIDPKYAEKNRGKIQIGQWCYEIYVGTTDDVPALLAPTNPSKPSHYSISLFFLIRLFVESQIQNEESSMNYQLSDQLTATTTVPHPMPTRKSILLQ